MKNLLKKPAVILWLVILAISIALLLTKGLQYGVDFSGGTSFSIVLENQVAPEDMPRVVSVINSRLDWAGLKDAKVTSSGNQYITAQLAESDPDEIARLKNTLLKQGRFEAVLDGNVLFVGEDIRTIYKDPAKGYGIQAIDKSGASQWVLPFMLSPEASRRFAEMTFHKCSPTGYENNSVVYDCEKTYFFIDRPTDAIMIVDNDTYLEEKQVPVSPELVNSNMISFDEIVSQLNTNYYIASDNLTDEQLSKIKTDFNKYQKAIVSSSVSESIKKQLTDIGYKVVVVNKPETQPWIWEATGLKSIISLTEGVTNMSAPSTTSASFEVFNNLTITGTAASKVDAKTRLDDLLVILESGSLPIPIESISTESISPFLGKEFLQNSLWIGLFALLTVALVLFIRYKVFNLIFPMLFSDVSELIISLGFLSLIQFRIDLATIAGILAAIGTGVDHEVIITDELLKGTKEEEASSSGQSLTAKVKSAFFIIFAAVATVFVTMLPIIFFNVGLSKLVGFAITVMFGAVLGVFVTRPAFAEVAKVVVARHEQRKIKKE
jgi:preprotein translocase subunit SecD